MTLYAFVVRLLFWGGLALLLLGSANFLDLPWMNRLGYAYNGMSLGMMLGSWLRRGQ